MDDEDNSVVIKEKFEADDVLWIRSFMEEHHPVDVADALSKLNPKEIIRCLMCADVYRRAEVFAEFDLDMQKKLASIFSLRQFAEIVTHMSHDKRADLLNSMPEEEKESLMPVLAHVEREDIRNLAAYPEGSAGAVMTSDYTTLSEGLTCGEALKSLRDQALGKETIYYSYIVDKQRKLVGVVSLKELVLSPPNRPLDNIVRKEVITGLVDDDQEEIARKIEKYNLLALPIVDKHDVLVGIVTHDDAVDIIKQEYTEDIEKLMAISGPHKGGYISSSVWEQFQSRCYWIVSLAILGMVSGYIIHYYEHALSSAIILALYLPMLIDTGGNVGSQSATIVIRALALREISFNNALNVIWKELQVSILIAGVVGLITWAKVFFLSKSSLIPESMTLNMVAIAIALALVVQVITSAVIGAILPMAAEKLKLDPAVVASPALTTVVDATGLVIYFTTAKLILGI
ncbi:MAG: magnesium transporter [Chlamydiales bacterium]|nr:magnesium transporter [Chlamydiales bacterium]